MYLKLDYKKYLNLLLFKVKIFTSRITNDVSLQFLESEKLKKPLD